MSGLASNKDMNTHTSMIMNAHTHKKIPAPIFPSHLALLVDTAGLHDGLIDAVMRPGGLVEAWVDRACVYAKKGCLLRVLGSNVVCATCFQSTLYSYGHPVWHVRIRCVCFHCMLYSLGSPFSTRRSCAKVHFPQSTLTHQDCHVWFERRALELTDHLLVA